MHSYINTASNFYYTTGKKNTQFLKSILLIVKYDEYFNIFYHHSVIFATFILNK